MTLARRASATAKDARVSSQPARRTRPRPPRGHQQRGGGDRQEPGRRRASSSASTVQPHVRLGRPARRQWLCRTRPTSWRCTTSRSSRGVSAVNGRVSALSLCANSKRLRISTEIRCRAPVPKSRQLRRQGARSRRPPRRPAPRAPRRRPAAGAPPGPPGRARPAPRRRARARPGHHASTGPRYGTCGSLGLRRIHGGLLPTTMTYRDELQTTCPRPRGRPWAVTRLLAAFRPSSRATAARGRRTPPVRPRTGSRSTRAWRC